MRPLTFGTDGVRGLANKDLTPEDAMRLGAAAARVFGGPMLVGRDTRISGGMLAGALAAGAAGAGAGVIDLGVLPTPGVAALAPRLGSTAAAVVSASHNPYWDNGIKFFSGEGRKLPEEQERAVEEILGSGADAGAEAPCPTGGGVGAVETLAEAADLYVRDVLGRLRPDARGLKILLDCANGAAYRAAPAAFWELGADLTVVDADPSGTNINDRCGSTHIKGLDASGHDVAFAFDGDADRVLAVDERGSIVDGDKIIAILARDLEGRGALGGGVVVTVMSNLGFFKAMEGLGIPYAVTPVGDKHVAGEMLRSRAAVGGEQSGHVILSEHATTGDGLVTAIALLDVMVRSGMPLSELAEVMDVYPQALINVAVGEGASAKAVAAVESVEKAVAVAEEKLGGQGRILLRPSGTEPVVRVMVEHEDEAVCREVCEKVARVVEAAGEEKG